MQSRLSAGWRSIRPSSRIRGSWPSWRHGALSAIVTGLFALNLEKAVFEFMGGFLLTFLSFLAAVPLLVIYLFLVRRAWLERRGLTGPLLLFVTRSGTSNEK
jgi:hypothetical protein